MFLVEFAADKIPAFDLIWNALHSLAIALIWLATRHPYWTAAIVAVLVALIIVLIRWVLGALNALFRGAEREFMSRPADT